MDSIYQDIAARTGGNVYIGVVGPVRTGKSTIIKRIMEELVIPGIPDPHRRERARDELPQSGSGRTIMTAEPKFVPEEAAEVCPDGKTRLRLRFIDSVGYLVPGAAGAEEEGGPRMVTTPWYDQEIPLAQAAELGTKKVMEGHCTLGLVVTTDGTVTDLPREAYPEAEARAISDMAATGKPFLVIINSREPEGKAARELRGQLEERFGIRALAADCQTLDRQGIADLLGRVLHAFPMTALHVRLPRWVEALEQSHPLQQALSRGLLEAAEGIRNLEEAEPALKTLEQLEQIHRVEVQGADLADGTVCCTLVLPDTLYYTVLSERTGMTIENEGQLLKLLTELAEIRREYELLAPALSSVKATGYGVVMPTAEQMQFQTPELVKKGGAFGVKLRAGAPSIHMVRVDIDTQISPMVGDEKQSRELLNHLADQDPEKLWESHIFGKSLYGLIQESLNAKVVQLPQEVREKFRTTLTRIVNDGATGLICLIL